MDKILRPVWSEIDLDAIEYNIKNIKNLLNGKDIIAVVKADCYGHGATDLVPTLIENGTSRLAVAVLTEAIELRQNKINIPIMILGYTPIYLAEEIIKYDIEQTVYDLEYAKELSEIALKSNKKVSIHIAIDTGMGRIGFLPNQKSLQDIMQISKLKGLNVAGIFTHFSTSDEENKDYADNQFLKFTDFIDELKKLNIDIPVRHASNSGAIIDMPETYLDAVRAGIILYGYYPSDDIDKNRLPLKPALTIKAKIAHVKELDKDMYISYGRTFKTTRKSLIATIPIGYADGYSRLLMPGAKVIVNNQFAPVVGRICMDQCMIDVTDIGNVKIGDEVILLGETKDLKLTADDLAKNMGTINYEVLCMFKHRITKIYKKSGKIVSIKNQI